METIQINLNLPPGERWLIAEKYTSEIDALIGCYWKEIKDFKFLFDEVAEAYTQAFIPSEFLEEIECISRFSAYSKDEILFTNLYYDIIKFAFGCTAFAVNTEEGILHARNLDWWTDENLLAKHSKVFDYQKDGKTIFKTVGWMGFVGVLSGMKPGKFAVTLNAILSDDPPSIAKPVTFLLRELLQGESNYDSAVKTLAETSIACDCLLLVSGINKDQFCVVERTPERSRIRKSLGQIVVANDYKLLDPEKPDTKDENNVLAATSCKRYNTAEKLLLEKPAINEDTCLKILSHEDVKMNITVQQMVFDTRRNEVFLF